MSVHYVLCFTVFLTQMLGCRAVQSDNVNCQWVATAIRKNSSWHVDNLNEVLQWYRPPYEPSQASMCFCNPLVGGLGNYSRIELAGGSGQQPITNSICSGCVGVEEAVTDYLFSPDDPMDGTYTQTFGPCNGITVYRCNCPAPTQPPTTIPTVTTPTITTSKPIVISTITTPKPVVISTISVDPYNPPV